MKKQILLVIWCLPLILAVMAIPSSGQDKRTEKKQELLKRVLREKGFHLPGQTGTDPDVTGTRLAGRTTATDQRITSNPSAVDEGEISVIYDPADSNNIVLSYMQQYSNLTFPIYYSSNGGATWTVSNFNSSAILAADYPGYLPAGGGDPAFAWDKNGKVYFSWIYLSVNAAEDTALFTLNWAYSTDKGHTWSVAPKHIIGQGALDPASENILPYKDGVTDREWLAVDNSGGPYQGNVYCSFVNFPPGSAPASEAIKVMVPGADTFGIMVPAFTGNTQFGNVEVDNAGVLHMSLADLDNNYVRHAASANGGTSFAPTQVVGQSSALFPSAPFVVQYRENAAINMAADAQAGTGNNVHIVWSDFPGGTVNSFYSHSSDGGITWSIPDTLNNIFPAKYITIMPTVAVNGTNVAISVTAIDSNDSARYYVINSTDNGNTFYPPMLVSSAATNYNALNAASSSSPLFFGDYNRSVRTQCQVYSTWADGRNNTGSKVYFAKVDYCTTGIQEITAVTTSLQLISVFPNPAKDHVTIQFYTSDAQAVTIVLTNMAGKTVLTMHKMLATGNQAVGVTLTDLPAGTYLLSVQNNEGMVATRSVTVR